MADALKWADGSQGYSRWVVSDPQLDLHIFSGA